MAEIIKGSQFADQRGAIFYNNAFDAAPVKRIYCIENQSVEFTRGWQGHQIENRWFSAIFGSFVIKIAIIDDWENPNPKVKIQEFVLQANKLDILHVPNGSCTSIQAREPNSRLLVMSDYLLGEIQDEYRFPKDYFIS